MTANTVNAPEPETTPHQDIVAAVAAEKLKFADAWPPVMIALGIALTIAWAAGVIEVLALLI